MSAAVALEAELEALLPRDAAAGAAAWLAAEVKVIRKPDESSVLFIPEGAWACVPRQSDKGLEWIGTDDATTCHCVAVVTEHHVAVAHLNTPVEQAVVAMVEAVVAALEGATKADVYVGGGMGGPGIPAGPTRTSFETTKALVAALDASPVEFTIKLACVGHLNTTAADGNPACRGLCVDLALGNVLRCDYDDDARGNEFLMRYGCGHLCTPMRGILDHYDHARDVFLVPAPVEARCARALTYLPRHASLPDEDLLTHSTSPGYERLRFARDQRGSALENITIANDLITHGKKPKYPTTQDGLFLIVPRLPPSS